MQAGVDQSSQRCLKKSNIKKIGGKKKILKSNGTKPEKYTKDIINNTIKFYQCMKSKCSLRRKVICQAIWKRILIRGS